MAKSKQMVYIHLMGFSDSANEAVNDSIKFCDTELCENVNAVHMFLALIERTNLGKALLNKMGTTFDMLYSSYQNLAHSGRYGHLDSSDIPFTIECFSRNMAMMIAECTQEAIMNRHEVTCEQIMNMLIEHQEEDLDEFLDYIGVTYEMLENLRYSDFSIPDELADFIEDLNSTESITCEHYVNVDKYTDEMIEILSRKKKANPCLVGEAGVGKTSVVYSLVNRIVNENVPDELKDTHICYINGATLTAGTRYRGDFEERMKYIMEWASESNVILFLDEIHTFISAGGNSVSSDTAGNMIKKYLSDGSIRVIGATTNKEYHKFVETDTAFDRRLQRLEIKEPSVDEAINMIKHSIADYENFHGVKVPTKIIEKAVKLSDRYIKDKYLPDKAYTILDQVAVKAKLNKLNTVTEEDLLLVISNMTGVNIVKLNESEQSQLINLEQTIKKNIIGQENAVTTVSKAIRRAKTNIHDSNKPLASFLFVGPTGVGKTELCKVLSKEVAVGDMPMIKIDMSEYSEKYSISKLIGSAPGYVGYGEGGQLTEKVKHNPYSLILFDEIEKAHPEVFNMFLQLLDEGRLTDGEGQTVDFTNCIIVMTSNAGYGADGMNKKALGFSSTADEKKSPRDIEKIALKALEETFKPEFLNRIDNVVVFDKLTKEQSLDITKLLLDKLSSRLREQNIKVKFDKSLVEYVTNNGYSDKYGARNLKREIQDTVEDIIADEILRGTLKNGVNATVKYVDGEVKVVVSRTSLRKKEQTAESKEVEQVTE